MKQCVIILAIVLFFKPVMPVLGYLINYDYVVKELCINKNNMASHCDGKCQLKSELAKASDNHESSRDKKVKAVEYELLYLDALPEYVFIKINNTLNTITDSYQDMYCLTIYNSIFHPPSC